MPAEDRGRTDLPAAQKGSRTAPAMRCAGADESVPFGGAVNEDRLGSAVKHFPYGEESATTGQDRVKFATYYRDETTTLDYADQRYYLRTIGRFLTADPYRASAGPAGPQSWNRYAYVQGDPVNYADPSGLDACLVDYGMPCFSVTAYGRLPGLSGVGGGGGGPELAQLMAPPDTDSNWQSGGASGASPSESFVAAANGLFRASDFLIGRIAQNKLPDDCLKLLAAAGVPDLGQLQSAARNVQIWDGTTEYILRESDLRQEPARSAFINSAKDRTIADAFAAEDAR